MKELHLKRQYNQIADVLLYANYDVKNVYTEQELELLIQTKLARTIIKYIYGLFATQKNIPKDISDKMCEQMGQTLYPMYFQFINKCYDNNIIVHLIDLPSGIQLDISKYPQSGLTSRCWISKTRKLKDQNGIDQYISMLKQHNIKQMFLQQILMLKTLSDEEQLVEDLPYNFYIRGHISQLQFPFSTQIPPQKQLRSELQQKFLRKVKNKIFKQEIQTSEQYRKLLQYKNSLKYIDKQKVNLTKELIEDLQQYNALNVYDELVSILNRQQIDAFCCKYSITISHQDLLQYYKLELSEAINQLKEKYQVEL